MLPKLKALHERAKERRVAYALITNLVGTLDVPAIRQGRFDEVIGIYPPDPLSRAGYFARVAGDLANADARRWSSGEGKLSRLVRVVARTRSIGMTQATSAGWFRCGDKSDLSGRPAAYIYGQCADWNVSPEPEDECDDMRGTGRFAEREWAEWHTLDKWDDQVEEFERSCVGKKDEEVELEWKKVLEWPMQLEVIVALEKERKGREVGAAERQGKRKRWCLPGRRLGRAK